MPPTGGAAPHVIHPAGYATAERLYGPHTGAIAKELGVTTHMIHLWRTLWQRKHPTWDITPTPHLTPIILTRDEEPA